MAATHPGSAQPPNSNVPLVSPEGITTDGRTTGNHETRYKDTLVRVQIAVEALYLGMVLLWSAYLVIWVFHGKLDLLFFGSTFQGHEDAFRRILSFGIGGLVGGTLFALKFLYRVIAHGYWSEDRWVWRVFSPWLSAMLAVMVGIMVDGGLLGLTYSIKPQGNVFSVTVGIGFVTGYFADSALAKMQDIANVVFGTSSRGSTSK